MFETKMERLLIFGLMAIVIIIAGCGPRYDFTLIDPSLKLEPLHPDADVEVCAEVPGRAYKPVAMLSVAKAAATAFSGVSTEDIINALKKCARAAGCPAMIDVKIEDYYSMSLALTATIPAKRGKATGIVWTEPDIGVYQLKKTEE